MNHRVSLTLVLVVSAMALAAEAARVEYETTRHENRRGEPDLVHQLTFLTSEGEPKGVFHHNHGIDDTQSLPDPASELGIIYMRELPFDIAFPGGTAAEFLAHVRDQWQIAHEEVPAALADVLPVIQILADGPVEPGPFKLQLRQPGRRARVVPNLVDDAGKYDDLELPSIQINSISLTELSDLISRLLPQGILLYYRAFPELKGFINRQFRNREAQAVDGQLTVALGLAKVTPVPTVAVFHVADLPDGTTVEAVVGAMETAWNLQGKVRLAEVKYHEDTQMLLIRGTPEEITAAQRVMDVIRGENVSSGDGVLENMAEALQNLRNAAKEQTSHLQQIRSRTR